MAGEQEVQGGAAKGSLQLHERGFCRASSVRWTANVPSGWRHAAERPKDQLRKLSRCHNCGRRGHWKDECPHGKNASEKEKGAAVQGFCYLGGSLQGACSSRSLDYFTLGGLPLERDYFSFAIWLGEDAALADREKAWSFLAIPSGVAILDIGATQDIVGVAAMQALDEELARSGLQAIEVANAPSGIGGSAKVARTMLVPMSPVSPLLSVGLLEGALGRTPGLAEQPSELPEDRCGHEDDESPDRAPGDTSCAVARRPFSGTSGCERAVWS